MTNFKVVYVHVAVKPRELGQVFYVGIGTSTRPYATGNRNVRWQRTAAKYGYVTYVLCTKATQQQAEAAESYLIEKLGYGKGKQLVNIVAGGNCTAIKGKFSHNATPVYCAQLATTFETIRQAAEHVAKGTALNVTYVASAIGVACSTSSGFAYGYNWSRLSGSTVTRKYTTEELACAGKRLTGAKHHGLRAVLCVQTGVVHASITEAAIFCGVSTSAIIECCQGSTNSAGSYCWAYVDERRKALRTFTPEQLLLPGKTPTGAQHGKAQAVVCIDNGLKFHTCTAAAYWLVEKGLAGTLAAAQAGITKVCKQKMSRTGGLGWQYLTEGI